jgi:NAD(P)-dependent dehydrogenase (short-subunit alcohol dehydrogenase family)
VSKIFSFLPKRNAADLSSDKSVILFCFGIVCPEQQPHETERKSMSDPFDLTGKIALVTGASRGIGESISRILARHGAHVIVSSRKPEGCEEVAEAIRKDGGKAEILPCHIGEMDQITDAFAKIKKQHGRLDILVNNAAANPYFGHVLDTDVAAFQKTVDVNIRGYFFMSVEAGRLMRENGGGVIINTASVNALQPGQMQAIYSITKAAVVNMTRAFAKECGVLGIRCNALLPGLTRTKFASALFENESILKMVEAQTALKRAAEPDEMAGAVLYLVSDAASYTTGECITVDGGATI